jgi:hypothetical protein
MMLRQEGSTTGPLRRRSVRLALIGLVTALAAFLIAAAGTADARQTRPSRFAGDGPVRAQVSLPKVKAPGPLHRMSGTVPLQRTRTVAPGATPKAAPAATAKAAAVAPSRPVQLRALIVAVDNTDWGVATWQSTLDRVGAAYDILYTRTTALTSADLVRSDATGKYNAILLTSSMLLYDSGGGTYVSGLDGTEWNTLWAYERDYAVRQSALYTSYGTFPEDYCLSASSEASIGDTPYNAAITTTGAGVFDYLKSTAQVPIVQSYVYKTRVTAGCDGQAVLTNGADVLGVKSTSTDGRERLALTFTSNSALMQANLLTYGLFRWASRGLFLGEQKHYLNVDVDDWFNSADHYYPDGHIESTPGYQMSGHDAYNVSLKQASLRSTYPLASGFTYTMAYNGADANLSAGSTCSPNGGVSTLTATTKCLKTTFRWINHTYTHPELNFTDYTTTYNEINNNRTAATQLGLSQPNTVLKTGEYSGLGTYNPDPNDDVDPPTDHGLAASNPNLITAAHNLGVKYFHGNMSFPSMVPGCFNCNVIHPLDNTLSVVPDWPTNIAYFCTTDAEETAFYNAYYGPNGKFPFWPVNQTYAQLLDYEATVALGHVATGSIYAHTFHIANLRDYASGKTLATDWADKVMQKYSAYYSVPLLNTQWTDLAAYTTNRNAHFAELSGGVSAVYNPAAGTIAVTSPLAGTVSVNGANGTGHTNYGNDVNTVASLTANGTVTLPAVLRP